MVGLATGRVGVLGLIAAFSDCVSDCVRDRKGRPGLNNCMFFFVSLSRGSGSGRIGEIRLHNCNFLL